MWPGWREPGCRLRTWPEAVPQLRAGDGDAEEGWTESKATALMPLHELLNPLGPQLP